MPSTGAFERIERGGLGQQIGRTAKGGRGARGSPRRVRARHVCIPRRVEARTVIQRNPPFSSTPPFVRTIVEVFPHAPLGRGDDASKKKKPEETIRSGCGPRHRERRARWTAIRPSRSETIGPVEVVDAHLVRVPLILVRSDATEERRERKRASSSSSRPPSASPSPQPPLSARAVRRSRRRRRAGHLRHHRLARTARIIVAVVVVVILRPQRSPASFGRRTGRATIIPV